MNTSNLFHHGLRSLAGLFVCSAALSVAPAAAAGFDARAQANASVYSLSDFQSLTPWNSGVTDGYEGNGANMQRSASAINAGGTLHGKTVASSSYADLATGKLGVAGSVTNTLGTPDIGSYAAVITSFSDSFRFGSSGGGAFAWNGQTARFGIDIDGTSTNTTSRVFTDWNLSVNIYSAGTFDLPQPEWAARQLGGLGWAGNRRPDGSSTITASVVPGAIGAQASFVGTLDAGNLQLSAQFHPGADFDWIISMLSFPGGLSTELGTHSSDFLHTATVAFVAPTGAEIQSGSGVFPMTSPIPEPGTWASMAFGLALLAVRARRRSASSALR